MSRSFFFSASLPSLTTTLPVTAPKKGALRPLTANSIALSRAFAASITDAPAFGQCRRSGRRVGHRELCVADVHGHFFVGTPSVSAVTCCITV
jgi:hypothetical protein